MQANHESDVIFFRGHPNVLGTHRNTIEITREEHISKRADCIIGVSATKACADLSPELKAHIRSGGLLRFEISAEGMSYNFGGSGSSELELTDTRELVLRRSNFASARTAAVYCEAAAIDIPRPLVAIMQNQTCVGSFRIVAVKEKRAEIELPSIVSLEH
jgi:uncharacterized protein